MLENKWFGLRGMERARNQQILFALVIFQGLESVCLVPLNVLNLESCPPWEGNT